MFPPFPTVPLLTRHAALRGLRMAAVALGALLVLAAPGQGPAAAQGGAEPATVQAGAKPGAPQAQGPAPAQDAARDAAAPPTRPRAEGAPSEAPSTEPAVQPPGIPPGTPRGQSPAPLQARPLPPRVLTVRGEAVVTAVPDMARFIVGVEVQAPTAAAALRSNGRRMAEIMALLRDLGVPARDIQTAQFSVYPVWDARQGGDRPLKITGFVANNSLQVRIRDVARLGAVLDALTAAGGNRIQAVSFAHSDPVPLQDRARRQAVADALRRARLLAAAAGVSLGPVLSIEEVAPATTAAGARLAALDAAPVPLAEGEIGFPAAVVLKIALR